MPWLRDVRVIVADELHPLNDVKRGPAIEIILRLTKQLLKNIQKIGLSETIGNPKELA